MACPDGSFVFTKKPAFRRHAQIYEMLLKEIGSNVAPFEVVQSVYDANPMSFWGLYRSADKQRCSLPI